MQSAQNSPPVLSVTQLTNAIKHSLEGNFRHIWLQGEISNFKSQTSGHLYFSIKDSGAQIAAVMFRAEASKLKTLPKEGAQVVVRGELSVYPPSGRYQIVIREMRLVGLGELLAQLEELKRKLYAKGMFAPEHKKPLPKFPKRIGVVTSPTGAAIQDILNVLTRRFSGFKLLINPVRVQGEGAAIEIAQAIWQFNTYNLVDVIIVGRGGGSIEDLWAFNEEIVADAIFHSKIPIVSAVGHETDVCLTDFVADVRAPTPSAAAAMVIAEKQQQLEHLMHIQRRLQQSITNRLKHERQKIISTTKHPLIVSSYGIMGMWMQRLDDVRSQIDIALQQSVIKNKMRLSAAKQHLFALQPMNRIGHLKMRLHEWTRAIAIAVEKEINKHKTELKRLNEKHLNLWFSEQEIRRKMLSEVQSYRQIDNNWSRSLSLHRERLEKLSANLRSIDPKNLLTKGYAILFNENDLSVITSIDAVSENQTLKVQLADGQLHTKVIQIIQDEHNTHFSTNSTAK